MTAEATSERVTFERDGQPWGGLLTRPRIDIDVPAIVLMPAIPGITAYIARVAADLAQEGFVTFSLDYYVREGQPPELDSREQIREAVAALPDPRVRADTDAALEYVADQPFVRGRSVAILGFCLGGTHALLTAAEHPDLSCAISFYGRLRYRPHTDQHPISPLDVAHEVACPVLGHYGDQDHIIPVEEVDELRNALAGKQAEIYLYPGAGHGFHEDSRPRDYRPVAAQEAWRRTLEYLRFYTQPRPSESE